MHLLLNLSFDYAYKLCVFSNNRQGDLKEMVTLLALPFHNQMGAKGMSDLVGKTCHSKVACIQGLLVFG